MKRILFFAFVFASASAIAQTEGSAFTQTGHAASLTFATDYQCVGINPANLGWKRKYPEKKATFGLGEIGYSLTTTAFDRAGLKDQFFPSLMGSADDFTYKEKVAAAANFNGASIGANIDVMAFGFSYQTDSAGGFAFTISDHISWFSEFNKNTADIMFLGYNAPYFEYLALDLTGDGIADDTIANGAGVTDAQREQVVSGGTYNGQHAQKLINGSTYDFLWYRSYGLSWGGRVGHGESVDWFVGAGVKYIQGFGMIDIHSDGGDYLAQSSLSPGFKIDYGENASKNPSHRSGDSMEPVGKGIGIDIGLSAIVQEKWKIGLAYLDLGSIKWDGNVFVAADSTVSTLDEDGFDNSNFFDQADNFASDRGIYEWVGVSEVKTKLPGTLRTGVGYVASEKTELGIETVLPMSDEAGSMRKAAINMGGSYRPAEWLSLNLGIGIGGNYPTRMPFGITLGTKDGTWEAGFGQRDIRSLFGGGDPTVGMCFGILRFRV